MLFNPLVKIFLSCLCGFLLSLSAPGYNLWFIAWFALSPLFIIIYTSKNIKEGAFCSFLFGFAYNLNYLQWIFSIHPLSWLGFDNTVSLFISVLALILVSAYNSVFFVLFSMLTMCLKNSSLHPYNKGLLNIILVAFIWLIVFNKISDSEWLLGFPWTLIEYSQYKNLYLIQIAEYLGSISIGFILVLFNLLLAQILISIFNIEKVSNRYISKSPGQASPMLYSLFILTGLIGINIFFGMYLYYKNHDRFTNNSSTICILQGNLPLGVTRGSKQDINFAKKTYSTLLENNDAKLILLPEGALPVVFNRNLATQSWLKLNANKKQSDVIAGSYCSNGNHLTNCVVLSRSTDKQFSYYEKERLVPFGEFTPFAFVLPGFMKKLASNVIGDGFIKGKECSPLNTSFGRAGINVCFELIFPAIIRKHSLQKANFLINVSDLSWFSSDFVRQQFLSFAVFRAIENRKWVVVAANNGISAFVEPNGKIKSQSLQNKEGVLLDWITPNNKTTFYSKYGW